ncbi:polyhydroxyalkanoate depolymerase [Rhodoferax sp.]|uniref:polyhydroxyalkanoate depolymerase n=1 Tax=Rhodoferax sp. TaxID=50421 RepID=UPI002730AA10|nr:polyhydroxyalkanoate depolymerase [Rhodoferax sp.]MDP1529640.1 polyhydroxyalkanoate depolymerase [Rhodoferax sp.]MDP1945382.1 polyhydroxyalkanoate depolymerase [Rhodoferax sp.]MDP2441465.1 polyhydroxyalkanoate depolymerase [Rhodoferax sp.]MDZ4207327.1 polyhydroxyalkanoate depolymerase [Rhodoferax sp.]
MLYKFYEAQRSLMEPFTDLAQSAAKVYGNPLSVFGQHPLAQRISAGYDLMHRLGKDYEKPEFGLRTVDVDGVEVAIHERIELKKPFCELRRFKRFTDDQGTLTKLKDQPAVLIVAPLSGHYATLLRDTVKTMLKDHKVYITDWTNARLVPTSEGGFSLDDYINYVQEFIRHVQSRYGNCHVMSVCQPTVPVLAAVSLMASRGELTPLSMVMMGGPIDARLSPTAVNNLAMNKSIEWFEHNVIYRVPTRFPGAGRKVYPGFLQHSGFVAMNPSNHARSHYDYFKDLIKGDDASADAHRKFYDEYNAVLDMDAPYYLDTIKVVFQEFNLVNGTWDVKGVDGTVERVRPEDIHNTALLSVEGELDDISGSGQTAAVHTICTGVDKKDQRHLEVEGAGHYGIFAGRRWRDVVYPQVKDFILSYQPKPLVETPVVVASPSAPVLTHPEPELTEPAPAFVLPEAPATAEIQLRDKRPEPIHKAVVKAKTVPAKAKPAAPAAASKAAVSKTVISVAEPAKPARKRPTQRHG